MDVPRKAEKAGRAVKIKQNKNSARSGVFLLPARFGKGVERPAPPQLYLQ
ncbi:hypothetical protein CHK_0141 [Christensenella hongkongensis]|uniref:Uncharacterized protein n=1 Tax=Christensenella hongkongensis TaxID=270498 RepID=A0A0M2NMZ3_9FIRM|nr:hypothetical protein CHK_0141 [Christensenella hongkongensis]